MIVTKYTVYKLHAEMTKTGMKTVDPPMALSAMLEIQSGYWKSRRDHLKYLKPYFLSATHQFTNPVQLIGIYMAPKCKYTQLIHELDKLMKNTDDTCDTILFGDFSMKSVTGVHHGYNRKLEQHMKDKFGFNQVIQEDTSNYLLVLDLCFTKANVQTSGIFNF